jgi:hypothetical protein
MNRRASEIISRSMTTMAAMCIASAAAALEPGEYEVSVRLDLPHVDGAAAARMTLICVTAGGSGTHGLTVLSANNPFRGCAASNIREDGGTLLFDIVCADPNAATASARYTFREQDFDGAIEMKMGGKNMTMTERQRGHRQLQASGLKVMRDAEETGARGIEMTGTGARQLDHALNYGRPETR